MTCRRGRRCRRWLPDTGCPRPSAPWPSSAWPTTSPPGRAPPPIWPRRPARTPRAVRAGEPTFPRVHGAGFWAYRGAHPEDGAIFDAAMSEGASARAEALRAARDLSSIGTVVDVGGGQGRLLAGLLEAVPDLRGVLVDRPEVVAGAEAGIRSAGGGAPVTRRLGG